MSFKITIPCTCGCGKWLAKNKKGEDVIIQICRCEDGSGDYDVSIIEGGETKEEKHRCTRAEVEDCISNRFNIDLNSMSHNCVGENQANSEEEKL
mgnify:FL=1